MKKLFTILAVIASAITLLLAVLPVSNLAIFPGILALLFGFMAFYLSKKSGTTTKVIPFAFYLTIAALAITTFKAFFVETEVANTEILDAKEIQLEEEAIEELENLEINDLELESIEIEDAQIENLELESPEIENIEIDVSELEDIQIE